MKIINTSIKTRIIFVCALFLFISGCAANSPLIKATKDGDILATEKLIREGANINESDESGYTPLMYAIWSGKKETVTQLVNIGADVNKRDKSGYTPLLWAASYGYLDMAKLLIDKGADVNARGNDQSSPLLLALEGNYHELSTLLIKEGADVNATNNKNNVALYYAAFCGDSKIANSMIKLLVDNGADASIFIKSLEDEKEAYYASEVLSIVVKYDKSVIPHIKKIILTQKKDIQRAAAKVIDAIGIDTHEVKISDKHQIEIGLKPIVNLILEVRPDGVLEYQYPPYGYLPIHFLIINKSNEKISIDSSDITVLDLNNKSLIISNVTDLVSNTYRADTAKQAGIGVGSLLGLPIITLPVLAITEAIKLNQRNETHEQYYNKNMFRKKTLEKNESIEGIVIYRLNDECENASLENYKVIMPFKNGRNENIFTLTTGLFGDIIDPKSVQAVMRKPDKTETLNITPRDSITNRDDKQNLLGEITINNTDQKHKEIKGIVLNDGNVIEGQILNISANAVIIRTKDGKILSYSFGKEVRGFVK